MRALLIGRDGQIGRELHGMLQGRSQLAALGHAEIDLASPASIEAALAHFDPDVIINAAAFAAVDRAESEPALAEAVNATGPALVARWAARAGSTLIHFSTDYVFDGSKDGAYVETDAANPLGVYGRSKRAGEIAIEESGAAHLILRTSWVYAARGGNFLNTMLRLAREREEISVVNDQVGAPTSAHSIAAAAVGILTAAALTDPPSGPERETLRAALAARGGIVHATCGGAVSWYGFAQRIFESTPDAERRLRRLTPIATSAYPTPARRPLNSRLSNELLARDWHIELPSWDDALEEVIAQRQGAGEGGGAGPT